MQALVVGAKVASRRSRHPHLAVHTYARAETIAIAARSLKRDGKPVIRTAAAVKQPNRWPAQTGDYRIHVPIVIDVTKGYAAGRHRLGDAGIGAFEPPLVIQREQWHFFVTQGSVNVLHIVEHVALRDKKILPTVVVEILQAYTPAGTHGCQSAESGLQAAVVEIS